MRAWTWQYIYTDIRKILATAFVNFNSICAVRIGSLTTRLRWLLVVRKGTKRGLGDRVTPSWTSSERTLPCTSSVLPLQSGPPSTTDMVDVLNERNLVRPSRNRDAN